MKPINLDNIKQVLSSRQQSEFKQNEPKPEDEDRAWDLWEVMTKLFHHAWTSREREEPTQHWIQLLASLTPEQTSKGLDELLVWESSFPPTVIQFRQLCLPKTNSPTGVNSDAYVTYIPPKRIESDENVAKREKVGRSNLDAMKNLFK